MPFDLPHRYGLVLSTLYWGEGSKQRDNDHSANTAGVLWFIVILTGHRQCPDLGHSNLSLPVTFDTIPEQKRDETKPTRPRTVL